MERAVALKRLRKILGPKAMYEINTKAPTEEQRAAAKEAQPKLYRDRDLAGAAMKARMEEVLDADAEYQQLKKAYGIASEAARKNAHIMLTHKIVVGVDAGLAFRVYAQAHSWESIFEILKRQGRE